MRAGALDLAIDRRRQALALRPFLQHGLGIAQGTSRLVHALGPVALDELPPPPHSRRRGKPRRSRPRRCRRARDLRRRASALGADRAELDVVEQTERLGNIGAALLAHQFGKSLGQFALVGIREGVIEHVGDHEPEHVVTEESSR